MKTELQGALEKIEGALVEAIPCLKVEYEGKFMTTLQSNKAEQALALCKQIREAKKEISNRCNGIYNCSDALDLTVLFHAITQKRATK